MIIMRLRNPKALVSSELFFVMHVHINDTNNWNEDFFGYLLLLPFFSFYQYGYV
jgi:hypothetical protein